MQAKNEMKAIKNLNDRVAGIIETIKNENGTAIKFADGTMICALNISVFDQAIDTAYGNLYQKGRLWTYPVAFTEVYSVICGSFQWGTGSSWGTVSTVSNTSAILRGIDITSRSTGTKVTISATAIGRWK